jgi:hypothetical protein
MKAKLLVVLMALMVAAGTASADTEASAAAHIFAEVTETVAVSFPDINVDLGSIQATGELTANLTYRLDCNLQTVDIQVLVTNLHKGDDPNSVNIIPVKGAIDGTQTHDVYVQPGAGNETLAGGGDNWLQYSGAATYMGLGAMVTNASSFESGAPTFSQDVVVTCAWQEKTNTELLPGEYSGWVVMTVTVPL